MAGFVRSPSASSLALLTLLGAPSASGYTAIYSTAARRAPPPRAMAPIDPGLSTVEIERPAQFPSYRLSPEDVVEAQLAALSCGNNRRCFRFSSPEHKRATGVFHEDEDVRGAVYGSSSFAFFSPPNYIEVPSYSLLVYNHQWVVKSATCVKEDECLCSARVFTRMKSPAVIDVTFFCSRQPVVRPACYEDDPLQAGVSAGPPGAGCWLVDGVRIDEGGGGGGDEQLAPPGGDGGGVALDAQAASALSALEALLGGGVPA